MSVDIYSEFKLQVKNINCEIVDDFWAKYLALKSKINVINLHDINKIKGKTKTYINLIKEFKPKIDQYLRVETPDYNIFKIIGLHKKEVTTHTPFLANLLDKYASHQHSSVFLNLFLKNVVCFSDEEIHNLVDWEIYKELGYIDLRIVNKYKQKAIFIENKIGIQAHSGQLSGYYIKWKKEFPNGGAFLFLNIKGDPPIDDGFDEKICEKKIVLSELKTISYKVEIRNWLEGCIHFIESKKLLYTIKQYIDLIDKL